jgi:TRAP-type C4-dicarboxylate transport system permease small subunit
LGCQEALLAINRLRARSNIVAPLPVVIFVGYVGLLWGSFEALHPTARQHGFVHYSLPFFWVIMAPSGTWRLNGHSCRLSFV